MNLTLISGPEVEPVSLTDLYTHLRLTPFGSPLAHPDDALLNIYLAAARQHVEDFTHRSIIDQTLRLSLSSFPRGSVATRGASMIGVDAATALPYIELPRPPAIAISSVKYYDTDNELQTVDPEDYFVTEDQVPRLMFKSSFSVPALYDRGDAVRIEYRAGYEPVGSPLDYRINVPEQIISAVLIGVQLQYDDLLPDRRKSLETARDGMLKALTVPRIA